MTPNTSQIALNTVSIVKLDAVINEWGCCYSCYLIKVFNVLWPIEELYALSMQVLKINKNLRKISGIHVIQ